MAWIGATYAAFAFQPYGSTRPEKALRKARKKKASKHVRTLRHQTDLPHDAQEFLICWGESPSKTLNRFENGLSYEVRCVAWQLASQSIEILESNRGVYYSLLDEESSYMDNIHMDLERTWPFFQGEIPEEIKTGTVNILKAYSVKDDVIGYAQGVNYVAAALIYVGMEEESAFWLLMRIMKGYSLERLYPSQFTVMSECFEKFDQLLQLYVPRVFDHLDTELGVSSSYYVQQWFQTIFLYSQRLELSLRVIDLLVSRQVEALFAVGLSIMTLSQDKLLQIHSFPQALSYLREIAEEDLPTDAIIHRAAGYPNLLQQLAELNRQHKIASDPALEECVLL